MLGNQQASLKHACPDCGRKYNTQESLNRHSRNHSQFVSYICETCQATFKRKDLLNKHRRVHTSPRYRTRRACLSCSRLKIGCDTKIPCSRCVANNRRCTYTADNDTPTPRHDITTFPADSEEDSGHVSRELSEIDKIEETFHPLYEVPFRTDDASHSYETELTNIIASSFPIESADCALDCSSGLIPFIERTSAPWVETAGLESGRIMSRDDYLFRSVDTQPHTCDSPQQTHSPQSDAHPPTTTSTQQHLGRSRVPSPQQGVRGPMTREIVESIVNDAFGLQSTSNHQASHTRFWYQSASKIETAFGMRATSSNTHVLDQFLALYFQHFHAKWPIIWKRGVVRDNLPPHLYLVMTAIGSACGENAAVAYSAEMLKALTPRLLQFCLDQHHTAERVLILSQSILLFQVALLYFGRTEAFLLCHQISALWIPVCRRFHLFDESQSHPATTREHFINLETKRRLGMTCVHIDTSISALLGFQPLLQVDEIRLQLPVPDYIWLSEDVDDIQAYRRHKARDNRSHSFASLVQSTLSSDAIFPNVQPNQLELLLHGLLHHLWSAASPSQFQPRDRDGQSPAIVSERRGVSCDGTRQVASAIGALKKCRKVLDKISVNAYTIPDRTSLLTSAYLHGIGIVRLGVDIHSICKLARDCCSGVPSLASSSGAVNAYNWANTDAALLAADAACYHWGRTADELLVPKEIRADFTIAAHVALLYSALIIWVFSSCRRDGLTIPLDRYRASTARSQHEDLNLCVGNSGRLLENFADLLLKIQHTQSSMRFSFAVYHSYITSLSKTPFPLPW